MKRLVFFLLLISCLSLTRKQNAILSKIDFVEGDNDKSILYEAFDQVRKKLFAKLTSSHIWEADTLILFESWNIQSGEHWGTLWSRGVSYNYQYLSAGKDSFVIKNESSYFSDFVINNILKRNDNKIQEAQNNEGALLDGCHVDVYLVCGAKEYFDATHYEFDEFFSALRAPNEY